MEIEKLIDTYSDYLYRIAFIYTKDRLAAEEVVQDVFVNYYHKSDQFEQKASIKTYLVKMTINRSYDYLRSWKNKKFFIAQFFQQYEKEFYIICASWPCNNCCRRTYSSPLYISRQSNR